MRTYHELQRFSPRLLALVWLLVMVLAVALEFFTPDEADRPLLVMPLVALGILALVYAALTLRTEVREGLLVVRLWPLPSRKVPVSGIRAIEVVEYRPLRDFGGWGWRFGPKGTIYNAAGNRAVRLELDRGRPLYIGSQRPEALAAALRAIMEA